MFGRVGRLGYVEAGSFIGVGGRVLDIENYCCWVLLGYFGVRLLYIRTPFEIFRVFLAGCDVEHYGDSELCFGNIYGGVVSVLGGLRGLPGAVPVISSGKMDSRTSLSSCWSSTPIARRAVKGN